MLVRKRIRRSSMLVNVMVVEVEIVISWRYERNVVRTVWMS